MEEGVKNKPQIRADYTDQKMFTSYPRHPRKSAANFSLQLNASLGASERSQSKIGNRQCDGPLATSGDTHIIPLPAKVKPRPLGGGAKVTEYVVVRVESLACGDRCKLIAACPQLQASPNFLRSEENAASVIAVVKESELVILPAMCAPPEPVTRTPKSRTRTGSDTKFRHYPTSMKSEHALKRSERIARLAVTKCHHRSPHTFDGFFAGLPRRL